MICLKNLVIILCFVVDNKAWQKNEEFAREFLAGLNPVIIALVKVILITPIPPSLDPNSAKFQSLTLKRHVCIDKIFVVSSVSGKADLEFLCACDKQEFPLKSSLNPAEFGDPTSAISKQHIEGHLEGLSIEQVTEYSFKTEILLSLRFLRLGRCVLNGYFFLWAHFLRGYESLNTQYEKG